MPNDDAEEAVAFHNATKYYALSDSEPGDERIGIGDKTSQTEAIWQKDWDIKPLLYKVYEEPSRLRRPSSRTRRCSAGSVC